MGWCNKPTPAQSQHQPKWGPILSPGQGYLEKTDGVVNQFPLRWWPCWARALSQVSHVLYSPAFWLSLGTNWCFVVQNYSKHHFGLVYLLLLLKKGIRYGDFLSNDTLSQHSKTIGSIWSPPGWIKEEKGDISVLAMQKWFCFLFKAGAVTFLRRNTILESAVNSNFLQRRVLKLLIWSVFRCSCRCIRDVALFLNRK